MFGNLGVFVNGNMFAGLFGPDVGVRLDDAGHDELAVVEGSGPFGPAERPDDRVPRPAGRLAREPGRRGELGGARAGACPVDATQGQEAEAVRQALVRTRRPGMCAPAPGSQRIASTMRGAAPKMVWAMPQPVNPAAR